MKIFTLQTWKKLRLLAAACLLGSISACGGGGDKEEIPPTIVKIYPVKFEKVDVYELVTGRATAATVAEVRPQVSGIIQKRFFQEGSFVEEGAVLYQIDPALYQATLNSALANLQRAKASANVAKQRADRTRELVKSRAVSQQENDEAVATYQQALAEVASAEASAQTARINLDYTEIKAPIAGRIGRSRFTEGALATANQSMPLAEINHLNPIYIDLSQSSRKILEIQRRFTNNELTSDPAKLLSVQLFIEGAEYPHKAELLSQEVTIGESTGSVALRAVVTNPEVDIQGMNMYSILPGQFVTAKINVGTREKGILIPIEYVLYDQKGATYVWLYKETELSPEQWTEKFPGVAYTGFVNSKRMVQVGMQIEHKLLIDTGLNEGDTLITDGFQNLRQGNQSVIDQTQLTAPAEGFSDTPQNQKG